MRLVDEITDRSAARPLPAPTGHRAPTGQRPVAKAPPPAIPLPESAAPALPRLPPVAPKFTDSTTGQGPTALATAMLQFQNGSVTPTLTRAKRRHKGLIFLGMLLVLTLVPAAIFRNSAFVERFTGKGYDTNPLPTHAFPEPALGGAEYTLTTQSVAVTNGLPTNLWRTERDQVNYTAKVAKLTVDRAKASVIGGTIGTPQSVSPPTDVYIDAQSTYLPGTTQSDPWTREPHDPGSSTLAVLSPHEVLMYQDVIDPALRSQHPTSVVSEMRHAVAVTTYTYTFPFGKFYESAPRLFDLVRMMDGNAGSDASVTVTISLDEQWMVRFLDINIDFHAVLKYKAARDVETDYPYRYTVDVVSVSDKPSTVSAPTNVVDATTTTTTTPAPIAGP